MIEYKSEGIKVNNENMVCICCGQVYHMGELLYGDKAAAFICSKCLNKYEGH